MFVCSRIAPRDIEPRRLGLDPLAPGLERRIPAPLAFTSMWMRFLIDFFSGTIWNQMRGPSPFGSSILSEPDAQLVLGHADRPVEVVPRVEAGRRWCDDIVQRLGPEVREQFG